jgi:hypothetical protein
MPATPAQDAQPGPGRGRQRPAVSGTAVSGTAVSGTAVNGTAVNGTAVRGRGVRGPAIVLPAVLLAGALALAACGSASARHGTASGSALTSTTGNGHALPVPVSQPSSGSLPVPPGALCADPAAPSEVVIARSPTLERLQPQRVVLSAQTTVTDAARVHALARALCALPPMSTRVMCPMLVEGAYTLWFGGTGRPIPEVRIQQSGCQVVTGLGTNRTVATSPRFWQVLARTAAAGVSISPLPVYLPETRAGTGCEPASRRGTGTMRQCPGPAQPGVSPGGPMHTP